MFGARFLPLAGLLIAFAGCSGGSGIQSQTVPSSERQGTLIPQVAQQGNGQTVIVFPAAPSSCTPTGLIRASDGNFWFGDLCAAGFFHISNNGIVGVIDFGIAKNIGTDALAEGPDKNLWYPLGGYIGRIGFKGNNFARFRLPSPGFEAGSTPIVGPDGALWFSEASSVQTKLARMTFPNHVITDYDVPNGAAALAAGPDGNIWLTGDNFVTGVGDVGFVVRFDISTHTTTSFQLPNRVLPGTIIGARDGNLYVSGSNGSGQFFKVTPSGNMTLIPNPDIANQGRFIIAMVPGPNSKLWTLTQYCDLQTFDTATQAFSAPLISHSTSDCGSTGSIAWGGDGNVWFTVTPVNSNNHQIDVYLAHSQTVTPNALTFTGSGTKTFTVTESGFSGTFYARSSNTSVATVNSTSMTGSFSVTATGKGTAIITVADTDLSHAYRSNTSQVSITVTP